MSLPSLSFYCDESSYRGSRFAAVAGILIRPDRASIVNNELARLKVAHRKSSASEIKWEKINRHDLPLYRDVATLFFSLLKDNLAHFHVVICDFSEYDHRKFNGGDKSVSVSKTYYQLLLHRCCKNYGDRAHIHVRPDTGDCTRALPSFVGALNSASRQRFGHRNPVIRSINLTPSHSIGMMQINDIILGAIASHRNGRHLQPDASAHKMMMTKYVLEGFGFRSYAFNTPAAARNVTLWNWRPLPGRSQS